MNLQPQPLVRTRWGKYAELGGDEQTAHKYLCVKPRTGMSLQSHRHRDEVWNGVRGEGYLLLGQLDDSNQQLYDADGRPLFGRVERIKCGSTVTIVCGQAHLPVATGSRVWIVHETWLMRGAERSTEADIVRFGDPYHNPDDAHSCRSWLENIPR